MSENDPVHLRFSWLIGEPPTQGRWRLDSPKNKKGRRFGAFFFGKEELAGSLSPPIVQQLTIAIGLYYHGK